MPTSPVTRVILFVAAFFGVAAVISGYYSLKMPPDPINVIGTIYTASMAIFVAAVLALIPIIASEHRGSKRDDDTPTKT